MKNIRKMAGTWQADLKVYCNSLTPHQRLRFILIISILYLLMAMATMVWIYLDAKRGKKAGNDIDHITNPLPALQNSKKVAFMTTVDNREIEKLWKRKGKVQC
ncbi:TraL conjugative transposon family protein [Chryseobacterium paludis]|uniref:TraL conjugative transposon family protein n=1 Tax=Chryseobacterium paludis TaxID=2956784 RepID=UPI0021BF2303|nr:TraL conjugative transposon family protein [Chryseobacterium paludis]